MNKEIEKLKEEKRRNEAKIKYVSHEIKALEAEEKSLLRKQRNHRIFTRGGMLEAFLQEPLLLTDDQVCSLLKVIFHRPEVDQILKQMIEGGRRMSSFKPQRLQGFLCAEGDLVRIAGQATVCLKESLLQISSPFWRCFKYKLESLQGILQSLVAVEDCKQYNRFKLRLHCCW